MTATLLPAPGVEASVPLGRGLWRLTLHRRTFAPSTGWQSTIVAELNDARGRSLEQLQNQSAKLVFTLNGRSPAAKLIQELEHDVVAWRYDYQSGTDVPYFRGIVAQAEDQITEQEHTVNFTCHDYFAMLSRRYLTGALVYAATDQDSIVAALLAYASNVGPSAGGSFAPGAFLPLTVYQANADGTSRTALSGQLRDRTYAGQSEVASTISDLAAVIGGFDFDVVPAWHPAVGGALTADALRVFYPQQGVTRTDPVLEYGGAIATVTRTVDSGTYANYVRVIGNNASSDPAAPQLYGEAWNTDSNNVGTVPIGLWQNIDNASDVTVAATLVQQAQGDLDTDGVLIPSYTLGLRPGAYREGAFRMGDAVPIVIRSGRLNVNTTVRVVGMTFTVGDDGQEDVALTVGRPPTTLVSLLAGTAADVDALARR